MSFLSSSFDSFTVYEGLADVTLRLVDADGVLEDIKVHKMILSCKSHYFALLFTKGFKEQYQPIVSLPFDPLCFKPLLQFLYNMEPELRTLSALPRLLELADYIGLASNVEAALLFTLRKKVKNADIRDLIPLHLKLRSTLPPKKSYESIVKDVEEEISLNINEAITLGLLNDYSSETVINILETALYYTSDNTTLYTILNEIRIRMKAHTFIQMLNLV